MFCENCGATMKDDALFCNNCGANNKSDEEQQYNGQTTVLSQEYNTINNNQPQQQAYYQPILAGVNIQVKKPMSKNTKIIIGVVIAVVVVLFIFLANQNNKSKTIYGKWYSQNMLGSDIEFNFQTNGTLSVTYSPDSYATVDSDFKITGNKIYIDSATSIEGGDYTFTIQNNRLILKSDSGQSYNFERYQKKKED